MLSEVQQPVNDERTQLINQVIDTVVEAHMSTCHYTKEKVETGMIKFSELKASGNMVSEFLI